ncbi:MAG: tetratricopeptide repeat protein, partial [Promethearchaeota archaeon]
ELAWYNLAVALENKGDFDGAIEAYKKVIELDPKDDETWDNLSIVLEKAGDLEGAKEAKREANLLKKK